MDEDVVHPTLSPSRAGDFKTCPLLYRLRTIDRLPEQPTLDQVRGTLVHAVLEKLYELPAARRVPAAAAALVAPSWAELRELTPEVVPLFTAPEAPTESDFLDSAGALVDGYFRLEDPRRLEPAAREFLVSALIDGQLVVRGYVDRLDETPGGELRVVDYKTGGAPREAFEARALFQLKFYALALWRTRGTVPRMLRLVYLKDNEVCDYAPEAAELERFERTVLALWAAIEKATEAGDFRPRPSRLCGWCSYQEVCPAFGGTPPAYPSAAERQARAADRRAERAAAGQPAAGRP